MLLYLHGGPGMAELSTMGAFAAPLTSRYRLVGWDQRGAGASSADGVSLDRLAADLMELVHYVRGAFRPPSIVLLGHSWGALLGRLALDREPDLVDGFVGIGPLVAGGLNEPESHRMILRVARERRAVLLERLLLREPPPYGPRGGALVRKTLYAWALGGVVRPRRRLVRLAAALATFGPYSLVDRTLYVSRAARTLSLLNPEIERMGLPGEGAERVPVLFCLGRHDLVTPPNLARAAFERLGSPRKEWAWFDDAGHSPHYDDPEGFATVLDGWHERTLGPAEGPERRDPARALALRHGWNASAYAAAASDVDRWFAPGEEAVVPFVRHAGVRVVAGAPIAPASDTAAVADAFERDARRQGDGVCWFGADERLARIFAHRPDHDVVLLGAQPVWDPRDWRETVREHRSVRSQLARARNKGVRVEHWPEPTARQLTHLGHLQAAWLARKGLPRLHFLTDPDTLRFLDERRLLVASREGEVVGFLVASPVAARGGWLVEQIVRSASAPNGTAELLIDAVVERAASEGCSYLTLGPVPLARHGSFPHGRPPPWLRPVLRLARVHGRRFYNFEGLEYFKAKLVPLRWDPYYAISTERTFSPRSLWAVAGAFSGGAPLRLVARALARAARSEVRGAWERLRPR